MTFLNAPGLEWFEAINDTKVLTLNGVVWPGMQESYTRVCRLLDVIGTASWGDGVKVLVLNEVGWLGLEDRRLIFLNMLGLIDETKVLVLNEVGWHSMQTHSSVVSKDDINLSALVWWPVGVSEIHF